MSYILEISVGVPGYTIEKNDLERFYMNVVDPGENGYFLKKLRFVNNRTAINTRYSCIPDYSGNQSELYKTSNYLVTIEERMALYKTKIVPFAVRVIDDLFFKTGVTPGQVTHLITVSCTGQLAPGIEFLIAEHYGMLNVEKNAINFLGCYAALRAMKQAHYIAQSEPDACILVVCAELCSLHFYPSVEDEEMLANLLFSDGAAAFILCGENNGLGRNKNVLRLDTLGSAVIPQTSDLMTWNISSSAFRMFLGAKIANVISNNIEAVFKNFLRGKTNDITNWAIHPGGVKIVEAVRLGMSLSEEDVKDSLQVLRDYGNMSSPTILFILNNIFSEIKKKRKTDTKIFACAFGPGVNVEMISMKAELNEIQHDELYEHAPQA